MRRRTTQSSGHFGNYRRAYAAAQRTDDATSGAASVDFFFVADAWLQSLTRYIGPGSQSWTSVAAVGARRGPARQHRYVMRFTGFDVFAPTHRLVQPVLRAKSTAIGSGFTISTFARALQPAGNADAKRRDSRSRRRRRPDLCSVVVYVPYTTRAPMWETPSRAKVGGLAMVSFHDRPLAGERFSGTEHRADYQTAYFAGWRPRPDFDMVEDIGDVCGSAQGVKQNDPPK